jgi:hypothetical protein
VPAAVLQTAVTPLNVSGNIRILWISMPTPMDPGSPGCIVILYFAELQVIPANAVRQINVVLNDKPWYTTGFTPEYRYASVTYNTLPFEYLIYDLSIEATGNATLPPLINAVEIFFVFATTNLGTDSQDGMS